MVENNIGKDLQWIRVNGAVCGFVIGIFLTGYNYCRCVVIILVSQPFFLYQKEMNLVSNTPQRGTKSLRKKSGNLFLDFYVR